jgi:PAS domain S-box-containing protein
MNPRPLAEELPVGIGAEGAVMEVTRQVSAKIGVDCFRAIVTHLAIALKADFVFVGEFAPGLVQRVAILAASIEGEQASLRFDLPGSVCSRIALTGKPFLCSKEARHHFPSDQLLRRMHAEACIAIPLQNPSENPIGVLMAIYCVAPAGFSMAASVLEVFAARAAAELLHKQEKDKLRRSEQRHRAFVELNADGMWCVDFDQPIPTELPPEEQLALAYQYGYYSECNDAAARLIGLDQCRQVVGRRFVEFFPETDPAIRKSILDLICSGYRFTSREMARLSPDGERRFLLRSQWGIVENGRLQRVWGLTHDITDFKQCQHALNASKQRMMDLLEAVQLLVLVLDPSGTIQLCNNCFAELTGWRSDELKNTSYFDLMAPAEERAGLQAKFAAWVVGSKEPIHFESTLQGPDGRRWRVAWDSMVLRDEEGKVKAIASVGRDVTQEKALEDQLRQAQKIETVGRLAGGVAHDFNNLLTVIDGYTTLLLDKRSPADPDYPGLTEIRNAIAKGAQLTQQLLAFSRRRPWQPEVLNLNTIVERDASMLRRTLGEKIDLVTLLDPELGLIHADPGQVSQIILNLAVNARDAMTGGGTLTIASSNASISEQVSTVPGVPTGEYVQLTITDTGTGMTRETLDHLFEPFFTTKEPGKGTGLGLSIVHGILQQSGGYAKVDSELGRGTSFRIFLPRIQLEPPAAPVHESGKAATRGGTETILLVEDRQDVRALATNVLRGLGYKVLEADGPSQALEIAESKSRIDLLLTDMIMPGMQGTDLAERIKPSHAEMKIAIMSGYTGREELKHSFLPKPFTPESLAATVRHVLDDGQPTRRLSLGQEPPPPIRAN